VGVKMQEEVLAVKFNPFPLQQREAHTASPPLDTYLLLCVGGLEEDAVAAARAYFHARQGSEEWVEKRDGRVGDAASSPWTAHFRVFEIDDEDRVGNAGCGKLILDTNVPMKVVLALPFLLGVLAYVGEDHFLSPEREAGLAHLRAVTHDASHWDAAINLWARARDFYTRDTIRTDIPLGLTWTEKLKSTTEPLNVKFRASVLRDGAHAYRGMDMLPVVGDGASIRLGEKHVKVDLKGYDLEVVAIVLQQHVHLGLVLDNDRVTFSSNFPPERVPPILFREGVTACLRPSTARLLIAMCQPRVGDMVVDFMAGVGTIPFVAAAIPPPFPQVLALGGDESEEAGGYMRENFKYLREQMGGRAERTGEAGQRAAVVGLVRWDARCLPLRHGVVDVALVDLPFGKRHKHKGGRMVHLYERAFREMARVIRPGGRLLLLASRASYVEEALQSRMSEGCWSQQEQQDEKEEKLKEDTPLFNSKRVNIGGLRAVLYLVIRTTAPLPVMLERPEKEERKAVRRRAWDNRSTKQDEIRERTGI